MATAAEQVLNIAELLERILLSLPMKDILLDQRVAKFWKSLSESSPRIQQALFYRPDYDVETWSALDFFWDINNNFGNGIIVDAVTPEVMETNRSTWAFKSSLVVSGRPNPLLLGYREEDIKLFSGTSGPAFWSPKTDRCKVLISREEFGEWYGLPEDPLATTYARVQKKFKPSWCNMFLTQPPTKRLRFDVQPHTEMGEYGPRGDDVRCDEGITCGMFMEELLDECGSISINTTREQFIEIKQPSITAQTILATSGAIDAFQKLLGLCGSKQVLSDLVETVGPYNTELLLAGDNFARVMQYGLMEQLMSGEDDVEYLLWSHEHDLHCDGGCISCNPGLAMSSGGFNDGEESPE